MTSPSTRQKQVSRIIVFWGKKVLFVEKSASPGLFELPGGQRNSSESMRRAALRELREETNLMVDVKSLRRWGHGTLVTTRDHSSNVHWTVFSLPKLLTSVQIERKSALILNFYHVFS
jgi:ADP-ribose pyrophosphatase YjhB (NUDIX family)